MSIGRNISIFCLFALLTLLAVPSILHAEDEYFWLNASVFNTTDDVEFGFYPSGYSDGWWWGPTTRHHYARNEMLSGEWAAAISYYHSHNNQAEWLPTDFVAPDWHTDATFQPDSPTEANSTPRLKARSIIHDPNLRVTIDYKLIDLGSSGYASLPFYYQGNSMVNWVSSERYILIQTYNIFNKHLIGGSNITGLKFYQLLRGVFVSNSTYSSASVPSLLAGSYDPCNANSQGGFKYVVSQWGTQWDPNGGHTEWESFSSTIQPNSFENGLYYAGDSVQNYTTYDIKHSNLSGTQSIYNNSGAVAGAMSYNLPDIAPQQTTSITFAVMFGCGTPQLPISLTITDNLNGSCVSNGTTNVNLNLHYQSFGYATTGVVLECNIPACATVVSTDGGTYTSSTGKLTWNIGTLPSNADTTKTVVVNINGAAIPGSVLQFPSKLTGVGLNITQSHSISVCCDGGSIIYVDASKTSGYNNGTSWTNAFTDLQNALDNANNSCSKNTLYLAKGTYYPPNSGDYSNSYLRLRSGLTIYGGFNGESSPSQRQLTNTANATIFDSGNDNYLFYLSGSTLTLDGLTLQNASTPIYARAGSNVTLRNCKLSSSGNYAVDFGNSTLDTSSCIISAGIFNFDGTANTRNLTVHDCNFNGGFLYAQYAAIADIHNNNFHDQVNYGLAEFGYCSIVKFNNNRLENGAYGGAMFRSNANVHVQNCIIRNNDGEGLSLCGNTDANIVGCTIKDNTCDGLYIESPVSNHNILDNIIVRNGTFRPGDPWPEPTPDYRYGAGIYVYNSDSNTLIRNNTLAYNIQGGLLGDPLQTQQCAVQNNVIWGNGAGSAVSDNISNISGSATYNCIQGSPVYSGTGNKNTDPQFVSVETNNFHIKSSSTTCIDACIGSTPLAGETDVDSEARKVGSAIDMGADEFYDSPADLNADGEVDGLDLKTFITAWLTSPGWNLADGSTIDFKDYAVFAKDWLWRAPWCTDDLHLHFLSPPPTCPPPSASIYLTYDANTSPDANGEVTVYIHTDVPLISMSICATVTGDANITTAMSTADCNQYGWQPQWSSDPCIDPNGFVVVSGAKWGENSNATVGYFKFIYHSGQVYVTLTSDTVAYDANNQQVPYSTDSLIFGSDNMQGRQQSMMQSVSESAAVEPVVDVNALAAWAQQLWLDEEGIRAAYTEAQWQQFIDSIKSGQ